MLLNGICHLLLSRCSCLAVRVAVILSIVCMLPALCLAGDPLPGSAEGPPTDDYVITTTTTTTTTVTSTTIEDSRCPTFEAAACDQIHGRVKRVCWEVLFFLRISNLYGSLQQC